MARPPMPEEKRKKIRELLGHCSVTEIAQTVGVCRATINRMAGTSKKPPTRTVSTMISNLRKKEAKEIQDGCFNVYWQDWMVGTEVV